MPLLARAFAILLLLAAVSASFAQDDPFLPGLVATYRAKGESAARIDHQLSFHWGAASPDARLSGGEFQVEWQGRLLIDGRGDYRFYLHGAGEVEMKLAGKVVIAKQILNGSWCESPAVALAAEHVPLELSFRKTQPDARVAVFWSGPQFGREPMPPRLLFHPRERTLPDDFTRGQLLARTLRCASCHDGEPLPPPAPALEHLSGNLSRAWLTTWLTSHEAKLKESSPRRMPSFGLTKEQAGAMADWLQAKRENALAPPLVEKPEKKPGKAKPDTPSGERLFVSLGCLACHSWRDQGASGWLGGGDLTLIGDKRPAEFFAAWLADPARLNRDHRMPVFTLSDQERGLLARFLGEQKSAAPGGKAEAAGDRAAEGKNLVEQFQCASCHRLPEAPAVKPQRTAARLSERSQWDRSCLASADPARHRPGYALDERDMRALRHYYSARHSLASAHSTFAEGRLLFIEQNCLACHAREGTRESIPLLPPLLSDRLTALAQRYPDLAPLIPALTPPALNSVGDKLTDAALADAITRRGDPHRPYLHVRMPRFSLSEAGAKALVRYLVDADRVPAHADSAARPIEKAQQDRFKLAGGRLVSSDGFGCTSCHQVGSVMPSQAPLNARGPSLSPLDQRIRREWFERFVRTPARITPRMEMPSVQFPVSGLLDDKLDDQLTALWHVLNLPHFEPPLPNPIRTLRQSGHRPEAEALVLTDILRFEKESMLKPFLVGLSNRHNILFDLESASLTQWTVGDMARQRTKGKTWFWEPAGTGLLDMQNKSPDLALFAKGRALAHQSQGQFFTEADSWQFYGNALHLRYRLVFASPDTGGEKITLHIVRRLAPLQPEVGRSAYGFVQDVAIESMPAGMEVRLRLFAAGSTRPSLSDNTVLLGDRFKSRISFVHGIGAKLHASGAEALLTPYAKGRASVRLHYQSEIPLDRFPELPAQPHVARKGDPVEVAPGYVGERLPLLNDIMPTALAWRPNGRLVFASLKGQVFEADDTDGDGSEDRLTLLADGLPAPYGIHAGPAHVDVCAKYALLRLMEKERSIETIASGWGYTDDYHDWAVGLPRNERGEYFIGIPCQQDKRSPSAARFHGNVLRLTPRSPTATDPRRFALAPISAGHRFPMGLALDRRGELFVTDNQGNYNPFNELNHVRPGVHFGLINALDRGKPAPPLAPPAIDIPHPWTRSVNGICFLDTPKELRDKLGRDVFGPLEGHLIGCEYDTRQLIRMSLQQVGDTFQGAAYPLSVTPSRIERGLMGPISCAVSPRGELYVGGIRDSGWGAGNNVGEIVRVRIDPAKLPCGIAEVRAIKDGFTIDFCQPIDRVKAGQGESYTIQSYRRESTPAYGGPDRDRRTETVVDASASVDGRRVTLKLPEMRAGFVYELRLKNLAHDGGEFHPAEAHYTLRAVPK